MKEKHLIQIVNRKLPKEIHHQSMTNPYTGGTPDQYYDGSRSDLWAEYKMLTSMPRSGFAIGAYTPLQLRWMERRWENSMHVAAGQDHSGNRANVVGIVGLPNRTAVIQTTPQEWRLGTLVEKAIPIGEVSEWIAVFCGSSSKV